VCGICAIRAASTNIQCESKYPSRPTTPPGKT
jgi:hypothetical protein